MHHACAFLYFRQFVSQRFDMLCNMQIEVIPSSLLELQLKLVKISIASKCTHIITLQADKTWNANTLRSGGRRFLEPVCGWGDAVKDDDTTGEKEAS